MRGVVWPGRPSALQAQAFEGPFCARREINSVLDARDLGLSEIGRVRLENAIGHERNNVCHRVNPQIAVIDVTVFLDKRVHTCLKATGVIVRRVLWNGGEVRQPHLRHLTVTG